MRNGKKIVTTKYRLKIDGLRGLKIALVSDLHERPGQEAVAILKKEQPDLILVAGDILERCTEGESQYTMAEMNAYQGIVNDGSSRYKFIKLALHAGDFLHVRHKFFDGGLPFLKELSAIGPVYYGVGNHEWYFYPEDMELIRDCGITLLDNRDVCCELSIKKQKLNAAEHGSKEAEKDAVKIQIGGLSTRHDLEWLDVFSKKEGPKILISHHPEYYLRHIKGTERDTFDLIVSGHVHGGQWRIGGKSVLAPGQGFFPTYGYGFHDGKLVIGAGLSNTTSVPRIGNPMEVVIIEID